MRLAYFVHDLGDAAVARRIRMLHAAGVSVTLLGFRRGGGAVVAIEGVSTIDLGATGDGRLVQRIGAVLRVMLAFGPIRAAVRDADAVMARNLETLLLAARACRGRRLVYECLDIHRLLLGHGLAARCLQAIERRLLRKVDLVVTSSPRFADDYFRRRRGFVAPILLVENKVLAIDAGFAAPAMARIVIGPPWVIGWFGMLRCQRSFRILADIVRGSGGAVRVVLAGRPSGHQFPDFAAQVAAVPGMDYAGAYHAADLPALYGQVHFAWAIDYFEVGLNSAWLLPNRLYEAMAFGAVPLALAGVETGAWLARHGVGITVDDAPARLPALLAAMTAAEHAVLRARIEALPTHLLRTDRSDCLELAAAIFAPAL